MAQSLLTPSAGVLKLLGERPSHTFRGSSRGQYLAWRRRFRAQLLRLMGKRPDPVALRPRVVERARCEGYTRLKLTIEADAFSTVCAYLLLPDGLRRGERRPGILCAHGHGIGKESTVSCAPDVSGIHKQVAVEVCRQGYIVIAPDWRSFGERRDRADYIGAWGEEHGSDGCDLSYMLYGYFGYQMLTLDVCDASRCLDYLQTRAEVDPSRLGVIGCSFGGTMSTYTAALDSRIKAAVISGYLSTVEDAINERGKGNTCGSQFLFGLRTIGDIADVAGLIAPRPCLVQIGRHDTCFIAADALGAYRHLKRIYRAAGAQSQLELDHFDGKHEHNLPPAIDFLKRSLPIAGR